MVWEIITESIKENLRDVIIDGINPQNYKFSVLFDDKYIIYRKFHTRQEIEEFYRRKTYSNSVDLTCKFSYNLLGIKHIVVYNILFFAVHRTSSRKFLIHYYYVNC